MARGQGFASMSKEKRRELGKRGGVQAGKSDKKNAWGSESAKKAATISATQRLRKMAAIARMKLVRYESFSPDQLDTLHLTDSQVIYFGGKGSTQSRLDELRALLDGVPIADVLKDG